MHDLLTAIENSGFPTWIRESPSLWAYTFVLSLHAIGLAIVAGLSSAVDLRLLGVARTVPIAPLRALFPFMYAGFWINALSGLALLAANATGMLANPMFYIKIGFVLAAVLLMRAIKGSVFGDPAFVSAGIVPARARLLAGASLVCWGGAIVAGRMTAYPGLIQSWFASGPVGVT
ncbi:MAG TPA: hypothetical protein VLI71_06715 [Gammaproteobacteria bacterium]|nr:hypothetical protein [Gammaproteobacteria bacterium]